MRSFQLASVPILCAVLQSTSAAMRSGWSAASPCAIRPPTESPTTAALSIPRWSSSADEIGDVVGQRVGRRASPPTAHGRACRSARCGSGRRAFPRPSSQMPRPVPSELDKDQRRQIVAAAHLVVEHDAVDAREGHAELLLDKCSRPTCGKGHGGQFDKPSRANRRPACANDGRCYVAGNGFCSRGRDYVDAPASRRSLAASFIMAGGSSAQAAEKTVDITVDGQKMVGTLALPDGVANPAGHTSAARLHRQPRRARDPGGQGRHFRARCPHVDRQRRR